MTEHANFPAPEMTVDGIIKLAVLAVGGQGGGVLTSWIETVARSQGYAVQATSVAGVAQRTGATIYYIEMAPLGSVAPVFSLAPSAGDVDIMIAAEMMEVGRSIMRGFVTPDRTTLIGSTHRALAVSEKMAPGDGIANSDEVLAAARLASREIILADFDQLALGQGSVISASLFGALAGSSSLPFPREAFEDAIRASGKGVVPSLAAFSVGFDTAQSGDAPTASQAPTSTTHPAAPAGPRKLVEAWQALEERLQDLPLVAQPMASAGLRKVVGFQDVAYGREYLDHLSRVQAADSAEQEWELTVQAAKYLANAMAYDDVIRVAEEKTRAQRFARIRHEMGDAQHLQLTEYTHPRAEEIVSLAPAGLGRWIEARPKLLAWIDRRVNKGRRLRTDKIWPFFQLYFLAGIKNSRRRSLRHAIEVEHLEDWLNKSLEHAANDYALGVEIIRCRRLIKGYSDTHVRGLSKYDLVLSALPLLAGREDASEWIRRLRDAALSEESTKSVSDTLLTIRTFV